MSKCEECTYFYSISEGSDNTGQGRGDCVTESKDEKGKFWRAREVSADSESCQSFKERQA